MIGTAACGNDSSTESGLANSAGTSPTATFTTAEGVGPSASMPVPTGGAGGQPATSIPSASGSPVGSSTSAAGTGGSPPSGTVASGGTAGIGVGGAGVGTAGSAGMGMGGSAGMGTGGSAGMGTGGSAGMGNAGMGDIGDDDTCQMGVYDPANPPERLNLSGALGTHDPAMLEADGRFYRFETGGLIGTETADSITGPWAGGGFGAGALTTAPNFSSLGTVGNLWAPDIVHIGDAYHLYYSASSFGSSDSCIGHSSRTSMGSTGWEPGDTAVCSKGGDGYNAIDPDVLVAPDGTPWMVFGSFWSGIQLIELNKDGTRAGTDLENIASGPRGDGEGAFLVYRCGYYYLFLSHGLCCPGADGRSLNDLTYNIVVGRSESVHGPYVDKDGGALLDGAGTVIVEGDGGMSAYAAGHGEWIRQGNDAYILYHAYPGPGNGAELRVAELVWDEEGWPVPVGP